MAKKVSKKAQSARKAQALKEEQLSSWTTRVVIAVLLFAGGFVIGCAASARSVYNSKVNDDNPVNAIEPSK